ncbi:MAG TPA: FtsK/SpoIIIE domain-containing protein [Gemmatales bacterium]|nr:FtsK/SpoIIIE domain-containing protein [Gemmatales bacterium]
MAEPLLLERLRNIVRTVRDAIATRTTSENELNTVHLEKAQAAEDTWKQMQVELKNRQDQQLSALDESVKERKLQFAKTAHTELEGTKQTLGKSEQEMTSRHYLETEQLKRAFDDAVWSTKTIYEGDKNTTTEAMRVTEHDARVACQKLQGYLAEAEKLLTEWRQHPEYAELPTVDPVLIPQGASPKALLDEKVKKAEAQLTNLKGLMLPKLLQMMFVIPFTIILTLILTVPVVMITGNKMVGIAMGLPAAAIISFAIVFSAYQVAAWQVRRATLPLGDTVAEGLTIEPHCKKEAEVQYKSELKRLQDQKNADLLAHESSFKPQILQQKAAFEKEAKTFYATKEAKLAEMQARFKTEMDKIDSELGGRKEAIAAAYQADLTAAEQNYQRDAVGVRQKYQEAKQHMVKDWREAMAHVQKESQSLNDEVNKLCPSWKEWKDLPAANDLPTVVKFGDYALDFTQLPGGIPVDAELRAEAPLKLTLPALAPFPTAGNVLLKAEGPGKEKAIDELQQLSMRFLTMLPAGKARLTIFDPVGLGDNFAAFMHLADYDEALIAHRIWTEEHHFEQRLVDLTGHMESIIQKYLRNQYPSIEAYNQDAGEVAEPFRLLVVANYPANFNSEAAKRLVSVAASGARCGVSTFISMDTSADQPRDINLTNLEENSWVFEWREGQFHLRDNDFTDLPLTLAAPPNDEQATQLLNQVGQAAKDAAKVEVAFKLVHPKYDHKDLWYADSGSGINIPLGRVGATRRQALALGQGTSQHVLVAGKTGSGKSTLLNVLITNAALHYSPEQLELYLIDFKKGVEFKAYASHALPHARVVAIESEREFGLSVLQKLDAELKRRGEKFRELGIANIKDVREADSKNFYPRILLIVDEFQEFFVDDDRLAQEAALLLDRLVRQGRAFGIHVVLGSQTLGGAYTLARSTIDQMAVRIVLPCSESDGHMILGDDNHAARLLSRPGEAIYNDASGRVEGNHPFQICWLDDDQREDLLTQVRKLYDKSPSKFKLAEPIVFEGNAPAELLRSRPLRAALEKVPTTAPKEPHAFLGEAIAIKDASTAVFKRQSGSQLLVIGQDERGAVGLLSGAVASLAAQHPVGSAKFFYLAPNFDVEPSKALYDLIKLLPHEVVTAQHREVTTMMQTLTDELAARKALPPDAPLSPIFVVIYGLHRLRDLRRNEDDFSGEGGTSPVNQMAELIKEGAPLGIHFLVWVDTATGASRSFDRVTLREFTLRVLFQMSANDSSNLIDSPAAGKLGAHRALYHSEEAGTIEKLRPYGVPNEETLKMLGEKLSAWNR